MRKNVFFISFLFLLLGNLYAQEPLLDEVGPVIPGYNSVYADQTIIFDDEEAFTAYQYGYGYNKANEIQNLVSYHRGKKTLNSEKLVVANNFRYVYAHQSDEDFIAYYYRIAKGNVYELASATIPMKKSSNGSKSVDPTVIASFKFLSKGQVQRYVSVSPDKSMYTISLVAFDAKNVLNGFYVHVFNSKGEELWNQKYNPKIAGTSFEVHDVKLTDKGKVLFLLNAVTGEGKKVTSPTLQLLSLYKTDEVSMKETITFGYINSMRLLIKKNLDYFVGGYYSLKNNGGSSGYFTYVFNQHTEEKINNFNTLFYDDYKEKKTSEMLFANQDYKVNCNLLHEFSNEFIVMLGEQTAYTRYEDEKSGEVLYNYYNNKVFYNLFSLDGVGAGYELVDKKQTLTEEKHFLGPKPVGERKISPTPSMVGDPDIFPYQSAALSYCPIIRGNSVYLIYNDNINNYNGEAEGRISANLNEDKTVCLVLTKIAKLDDVERKVVMIPAKEKRIFDKVWYFDGTTLYFGVNAKKSYTLEKIVLNDQWSWD